uniref:Putative nodulin protein n=1 Tax=Linum usitatissimum TaxID=4006 RepID=G8GJ73_LINUS|nr:putative nodulin protein [Linum usitatissimum]
MPSSTSTSSTLRWLSLVGIIWLQSVNGTNTNFPAYSSQLKSLLSISQLQLNNLAFASDAGKLFGFLAGLAALHFPLWLVLLIGSALGLLGYGLQYLFITGTIASLTYPQIFLLTVVAGNSVCWINTVAYVVAIRNFPAGKLQAAAVGLSSSYQGLSAKIYTVFASAFFFSSEKKNPAEAYLLLGAILPLIVSAVAVPTLNRPGTTQRGGGAAVVAMFTITIATGVYSVVSSLHSVAGGMSPSWSAVGILAFLIAPVVVPAAEKARELIGNCNCKGSSTRIYTINGDMENGVVDVTVEMAGSKEAVVMRMSESLTRGVGKEGDDEATSWEEEVGVWEMVKRVEFWLYFGVYFCGATIGLVYLNNLGQIAESGGEFSASSLVSFSSSCGFFGRLVPSFVDYFLPRSGRSSRWWNQASNAASISALMALMASAFLLLVTTRTPQYHLSLYIATGIIAVSTGAITSIAVSTTTQLFGTTNFSINHNVVVSNIPLGSFAYGYLAAFIYRRSSSAVGGVHGGEGIKCMGVECYWDTFVIWGSLCGFGAVLALVLHCRMTRTKRRKGGGATLSTLSPEAGSSALQYWSEPLIFWLCSGFMWKLEKKRNCYFHAKFYLTTTTS